MKNKILLSILLASSLVLTGCNINNQNSSTPGSAEVSSSTQTSTTSVVNNIVINAGDSSLTQFLGLTRKISITASINQGAEYSLNNIEWFVDNVRSTSQTGLIFEFTPISVKTYSIYAKIGNVNSNIITLNVLYPSFEVGLIEAISARSIRVFGERGLTFSINGLSISGSSNFNLSTGIYNLNFLNDMIQGNTYQIVISKPGFNDRTINFIYDLRELKISSFVVGSSPIKIGAGGIYTIVKPFAVGDANKTYRLRFTHKNLEKENANYSLVTSGPNGATGSLVTPDQRSIEILKNQEIVSQIFTVTRETVEGLYTHQLTIDGKLIEVKVNIAKPTPYIDLEDDKPFVYGPAEGTRPTYTHNASLFTTTKTDSTDLKYEVKPETDGTYIITKPYNGPAYEFAFRLEGDYFPNPVGNPPSSLLQVALTGPQGSFIGFDNNRLNTTPSFPLFDTKFGRSKTNNVVLVNAYIDSSTIVGTYRFTITAGIYATGQVVNKVVTIVIKATEPTIEASVVVNGTKIIKTPRTNTFVIDKPISGISYDYMISMVISNYESPFTFGTNATTYYSSTLLSTDARIRYLLDYSITYSGPMAGIVPNIGKIGIEMGIPSARIGTDSSFRTPEDEEENITVLTTVTSVNENPTKDYNRIASQTNVVELAIAWGQLDNLMIPGNHIYTIKVGDIQTVVTLQINNPIPKISILNDQIEYNSSNSNIEYKEADGKYYVNGEGYVLDLKPRLLGVAPSANPFPFTYSILTPSGSLSSTTNTVVMTLDETALIDDLPNPFYGSLEFPSDSSVTGSIIQDTITLSLEGEYKISYNVNGITKDVFVVVLPAPQLKIEEISYVGVSLFEFNKTYYILSSAQNRILNIKLKPYTLPVDAKYTILKSTNGGSSYSAHDPAISLQEIQLTDELLLVDLILPAGEVTIFYKVSLFDKLDSSLTNSRDTIIIVVSQDLASN